MSVEVTFLTFSHTFIVFFVNVYIVKIFKDSVSKVNKEGNYSN